MDYKIQKMINRATFGLTEMGAGFDFMDIWYNLKYGFKNLYKFFWVVWKWRGFDFVYNLELMARGLEIYLTYPNYEIDEDKLPKEADIKQVIKFIKNRSKSDYITMAEKELTMEVSGVSFDFEPYKDNLFEMIDKRTEAQRENDDIIYRLAEVIEQREWKEIFKLIEENGQGWWN